MLNNNFKKLSTIHFKIMKQTNLTILTLLVVVMTTIGSAWSQPTAHETAKAMGRGINMGNTLEPPKEGDWNNGPAQEYYFDLYKEAGFTNVRVPVRWDEHVQTEAPFKIDDDWIDRVEQVVDWGLNRDLYVVLNCHHEESFQNDYAGQKERYDSIWSQIAVRFKDKSEKLVFEMMNEPHSVMSQNDIDEFNKRVLGIIRKTNPTRVVIYSGKGWASANDMMEAAIPDANDPYLMAYYHSYDPWGFAGEGEGTWGSENDINEMVNRISGVQEWSQENNIPVYIGEFGAQKLCDYNSRMFYYAKYVEAALEYDQCFAEWDDGGNFQTMIRKDTTWNDIKDILINTSDSSITNVDLNIVEDTVVELSWEPRSDSSLIHKILVEKRTLNTEFSVIAEFSEVTSTTTPTKYLDYEAEIGVDSYYRLLEVYANDTVPSYPQKIYRMPTERTPFDGVIAIPGSVEAENFDIGGQYLTYYDTELENLGGAYRLDEAVDIELRKDGGYQVGYVEQGEWMEYTVNVANAGEYEFTAHVASQLANGEFQIKIGSKRSSVITTPSTGDWETLTTVSGLIELEAGEQIMRFTIKGENAFNIDKIDFAEASSVINKKISVRVYPNPAKDNIDVVIGDDAIDKVEIFNSNGQKMLEKAMVDGKGRINIGHLDSGIYFILAKSDNSVLKQSFIKQ